MAARSNAIILFPLFIGILCLSFPATTTANSSSDVDFLYLTLAWPGKLFNLKIRCMPTTGEPALDFLVEDIKTYNSKTGKIVQNCKTTCQFYVNMKDYIDELYAHWSDLSCPCNNGLEKWKKTWCTYGQCSNLNQHDYIQTALNISEGASVLNVLKAKGIVPISSSYYKLEQIQTALQSSLGSSFSIECVIHPAVIWPPMSILSGINICVSKDGKSTIPCPSSMETTSKCTDVVWFYPFTLNLLRPCYDTGFADIIKMPTEEYSAV
ncbi:Ribonuclease T2-like protein [Dioscorea alata]|uniref:Ribonuclease T2-like protein n=1 Tax=Dioscorea alata TaxID=55571 RepID=A0ACB7W0P1_DIOAL|nr:Ribonuclease T2-like protein [Dioscorea alata]